MSIDRLRFQSAAATCVSLLALLLLVGCPKRQPEESASDSLPFAGQEIAIGVPAEMGFRAAWEGPLNEWQAQSGARCRLDEIPQPAPGEQFTGFTGDQRDTLTFFPLERAGELISRGNLAAIPASLRDNGADGLHVNDIFQGLRDKIASRKGETYFLPLAAPVLVCYYRRDLLQAAELKPPQTWAEYQELLDKLESWAPGCTAVEPWGEEFRATMFLARAVSSAQHPANYSLYFDIDSGEPLIDGAAFVQALQGARDALAKMPREVLAFGPAECRKELREGRAALAIGVEPAGVDAAHQQDSEPHSGGAPQPAVDVGVIRLPGSRDVYDASRRVWESLPDKRISQVTLTAFSGWGIGAAAGSPPVQIDAAWNALRKAGGTDLASGFPQPVIGLCRESQLLGGSVAFGIWGDPSATSAAAVAQSLRDARVVAELPVIDRDEFRGALTRALGPALDGSQPAEEALQAAAADWREIISKIGQARLRDSYRSSLGLNPKPR